MAPANPELGGHLAHDGQHLIAQGIAASAGVYTGSVRVVLDPADLSMLQKGEVLVVRASNPVWTVGMLKSGAIVAELGGPICHAAIIARELGIPCVVAVDKATQVLWTGMLATVDGTQGLVYRNGMVGDSQPARD